MKRMGITPEDLENINSEMMQAFGGAEEMSDLPEDGGEDDRGERQDRHIPVPEPPVQQQQQPACRAAPRQRRGRSAAACRPQKGPEAQVSGQLLHQPEPACP